MDNTNELVFQSNLLSSLEDAKRELFLSYLNKTLKDISENWNGRGELHEDGSFLETYTMSLNIFENKLSTTWFFYWNNERTLDIIKILINNNTEIDWKSEIHKIISETLLCVVSGKMERHFIRSTFAYFGLILDGEYWVNSRLRIAPASINNNDIITEQILYIDQLVEGIDKSHAISVGKLDAKRISALLSLLLGIGLYEIPLERRWFYKGENEAECYQLGFQQGQYPSEMPKKEVECQLGKCIPFSDMYDIFKPEDNLKFPQEYRSFFRPIIYNQLDASNKKALQNAAALYQVALSAGKYYKSVKLSYQIAAIDALNFGNKRDRTSFINIIKKYRPGTEEDLIEFMYDKIRSAHFHEGVFPGGEYDLMHIRIGMGPAYLHNSNRFRIIENICRDVFLNWVYQNVISLDKQINH